MLDKPAAQEILAEVEAALRKGVAPGVQQAIAANAIALALREIASLEALARSEVARLKTILGCDGELANLNRRLAHGIRDGSIDAETEPIVSHLILTALEKLAIDQPNYPPFRAYRMQNQRMADD